MAKTEKNISSFIRNIAMSGVLVGCTLFANNALATYAPGPHRSQVKEMIVHASIENGTVPASLALAVAKVESDFQYDVESSAGARGVMQIMPSTARGEFDLHKDELWDAETNIRTGVTFLSDLYYAYGQDWELALSHYNGGSLKKKNGLYVPHSYTRGYVEKVMKYWHQFDHQPKYAKLRLDSDNEPMTATAVEFDEHVEHAYDAKLDPFYEPSEVHEPKAPRFGWKEKRSDESRAPRFFLGSGNVRTESSETYSPSQEFGAGSPLKGNSHKPRFRYD